MEILFGILIASNIAAYYLLYKNKGKVEIKEVVKEVITDPTPEIKEEIRAKIEKELSALKEERLKEIEDYLKIQESEHLRKKKEREEDCVKMEDILRGRIDVLTDKIKKAENNLNALIAQTQEDWINKAQINRHIIQISDNDKQEIEKILDFSLGLSAKVQQAIRKAVFEIYVKTPSTAMINELAPGRITGIYKLTHLESGKVYIGQSVDINKRWKTHVKRGMV